MDHLPIHSPRGDHRPVTHHPGLSRGELRSAGAAGLVVPRPHQLSFLGMNILTGNHWETMVFSMKYRAFRFQCSHPILWNMMKLFVEWILLTVFCGKYVWMIKVVSLFFSNRYILWDIDVQPCFFYPCFIANSCSTIGEKSWLIIDSDDFV